MTRTAKVHVLTLGCPKNEVDSDRMKASLSASFELASDMSDAEVVVVNTCSFIRDATEESIDTILDVANGWLTESDERRLIVAGCMVSRYAGDLESTLPEVSAFVPVAEIGSIADVVERVTGVSARLSGSTEARTPSGPAAYLQVSDGCHRHCSYCTIPSIRGPYRSRTLPDILAEAESLVSTGARELTLIGQDITAWGRDLPGSARLHDVVRAVAHVDGLDWLRLMYAQPDGITDELLEVMATEAKVCHYIDMPLQHVSADVLRRMRRTGDPERLCSLVERIRSALPDVALRTSLIAGFPGETRTDVRLLEQFLEEVRFDFVGVFTYSPEEDTPAAAFEDQVPARTRRARAQRLRDLADRIGFERAADHIGQVLDVLIDGVEDGVPVGRWRGQAPEVDGVVLLDAGTVGELVSARIVDSVAYDLDAEVVA